MTGRVMFYVQHLLGIGHLRRAALLAAAAVRQGLAVTFVSGGEAVPDLAAAAGGAHIVQLAPVRALDADFKVLLDADGRPVDEAWRAARRQALLDAFAAAQPDAVVIEAFPFGRRFFRFELDPLIDAAWEHTRLYCSIRDILVAPADIARRRGILARIKEQFDGVFVHGDPRLVRLEDSFPEATEIADRLCYTGYVAADAPVHAAGDAGIDEVLVSAGGGAVGGALLRAALAARRQGCLADLGWRLLAGPNLPQSEWAALSAELPPGVVLERFRPDFPALLRHCRVSVSQAGYNTVVDILRAGANAVLVPFAAARETEQSLRAARLAARGVVETLAESELTPPALAGAIERAAGRSPRRVALDMNGAERTARLLADIAGISPGRRVTV
jgi:predicted glycosyltransferase